jgi:hypothetical protein
VPVCEEIQEGQDFAGLYGYNVSYLPTGFLGNSNRYMVIGSVFMSQNRLFLVDSESKEIRFLNFLKFDNKRTGDYSLLKMKDNVIIVSHSSQNAPSAIYALTFPDIDCEIDQVIEQIKVQVVAESKILQETELQRQIAEEIKHFKKDTVVLENGVEGIYYYNDKF